MSEPEDRRPVDARGSRGLVIGDFARVIINGIDEKVFKRLHLETRLGFILLGLLLVAVLGILLYPMIRSPNMKDDANCEICIAVAGFSQVGEYAEQGAGDDLAGPLSRELDENLRGMIPGKTISVWKVDSLGSIEPEALHQKADELAHHIHADVVVYGILDATQPDWKLTPYFYINADLAFRDALEIVGQHELGGAITPLQRSPSVMLSEMNDQMAPRVLLLSTMISGLIPYVNYKYDQAGEIFQSFLVNSPPASGNEASTQETTERWTDLWGDPAAARLMQLLLGNVALKSGQLELAQEHFEAARHADPSRPYARALGGLGAVEYLQAMAKFDQAAKASETGEAVDGGLIDPVGLETSLEYFRSAAQAAEHPDLAYLGPKTDLAIAKVFIAQSIYAGATGTEGPALEDIRQQLLKVVVAYEGENNDPILKELASQAHGILGLHYYNLDETELAIAELQQALKLAEDSKQKKNLQEILDSLSQ